MTRDITVEMHVQLKEGDAGSGLARRASNAEAWEKVGRASDLTLKDATKSLRIIESFIKAEVVKLVSEQGQPLRQSYSFLHRQSDVHVSLLPAPSHFNLSCPRPSPWESAQGPNGGGDVN